MINIYVAAPWAEKEYAKAVADQLKAAGFGIASRWLYFEKDAGNGLEIDEATLCQEALNDIEDVIGCDAFLLLNTQKRGEETSGKAVETGIAIATLKPIVIIGERTNVFHYLNMPRFATVEEAIVWMNSLVAVEASRA